MSNQQITADKKKATKYFEQNKFSEAEGVFQKKREDYARNEEWELMLNAANLCHKFHIYLGDYQTVLKEVTILQKEYSSILAEHLFLKKDLLQNLSESHFYLGDYAKSRMYAEEALVIEPGDGIWERLAHAENHRILGKYYWKEGFFYEAIYLYLISLNITIKELKGNHYQVAKLLNLIAVSMLDTGDHLHFKDAIELLKEAKRIHEESKLVSDHMYLGSILSDLGDGYLRVCIAKKEGHKLFSQGEKKCPEFEEIEKNFLREGLRIFEQIYSGERSHRYVATVYKFLSSLYLEEKDFDAEKILQTLQIELDIRVRALGGKKKHPTIAKVFNRRSKVHFRLGNYLEAAKFAHLAIVHLYPEFGEVETESISNVFLLKTPSFKQKSLSNPELLKALRNKTDALLRLFELKKDLALLRSAEESLKLAIVVIERIWNRFHIEESKLLLSKNTRIILELAFETITLLQEHKEHVPDKFIFKIISQSKSLFLLENLSADSIDPEPPVKYGPKNISELKLILTNLISKEKSDLDFHWKKVAPKRTPNRKRINNSEILNRKELKKSLEGQPIPAIIAYFMGEKNLFGILIKKEKGLSIVIQKLNPCPYQNLEKLRKACKKFSRLINVDIRESLVQYAFKGEEENADGTRFEFYKEAFTLYCVLVAPFNLEASSVERLYIIPDEELSTIPFEALITEYEDHLPYHLADYLLYKYTISYHSSITVLHHNHKSDKEEPYLCNSFLNVDTGYINPALFNMVDQDSEGAMVSLFKHYKFKVITLPQKELADKQGLFSKLCDYHIISITAHSRDPEKEPTGIILSEEDEVILTNEDVIKNLNQNSFNPELVVLNSCYTGTGRFLKGEGVQSMSRAFLTKGARNIIYSVIALPRQSALRLLCYFFIFVLEEKLTYGEALQRAKWFLVQDEYLSPKYWAGLILMGNQMGGIRRS